MVTIPPQEPMVRDSVAQTSIDKFMSAGAKISIRCSFHDPEGSTSYTSTDTANNSIFTVMAVFVVKRDWAYPQLRINDHIVTGRSVFDHG
jgi:hypothetical protein